MADADLVLFGGTVRTMDDQGMVAEAVALAGQRVLAVGDSASMRALARTGARQIDLRGRTALPGFIDSHNHMLSNGLNMSAVDLAGARTVADVVEAVRERVERTPAGGWVITSSRWHESQLAEQRFPHKRELDAVAPANPVMVRRGGHNVVANSLALRLGGVHEEMADPPGGTYVRRDGELTGHIIGQPAYSAVTSKAPAPTEDDHVAAIAEASARYAAAGITGVIEPGLDRAQVAAYQRAYGEGKLAVRGYLMQWLRPGTTAAEQAAALDACAGLLPPAGDERLRVGPIKIVADGGVETNFLREPYAFADDPEAPRGKPQTTIENLSAVCRWAAANGRQVGVHCVGDAAIDLVLDAFEAGNAVTPIAPLRWTLIHMTLARPEHFDRARALGLVITAQQPLIYSLGAGWVKYWGAERAAGASPMRAYVASGLTVGGGSDAPVTPYQPLVGIWSSVTRATEFAGVVGPEWACSVADALWLYSRGSAACSFDEDKRGQLTPGYLADVVVLGADPLAVPLDDLRHIPVELTIMDGRVTHEA